MAMTTTDLLHLMEEMQQTNRERVAAWLLAGKTDVSPTEAAPILGVKSPYGLNVAAKEHPMTGFFFRGRNLRVSVMYLLRYMDGEA